MKGLLLKDWYLSVKYLRSLFVIIIAFMAASVFQPDNTFFTIYPCVMVAMLPVSLFSYDDREKWNVYVQAFPVSRKKYVTEKYLFGAISVVSYLVLMSLFYLFVGMEGLGETFTVSLSLGLLASGIMLPILFRFGAEKGRIAYLIFIGLVVGVCGIMALGLKDGRIIGYLHIAPVSNWGICLIVVALYALSWRLSIKLYSKREL